MPKPACPRPLCVVPLSKRARHIGGVHAFEYPVWLPDATSGYLALNDLQHLTQQLNKAIKQHSNPGFSLLLRALKFQGHDKRAVQAHIFQLLADFNRNIAPSGFTFIPTHTAEQIFKGRRATTTGQDGLILMWDPNRRVDVQVDVDVSPQTVKKARSVQFATTLCNQVSFIDLDAPAAIQHQRQCRLQADTGTCSSI